MTILANVTDLGGRLLGAGDPVAVVVGLALALVSALGPGELLRLPLVLPLGPKNDECLVKPNYRLLRVNTFSPACT